MEFKDVLLNRIWEEMKQANVNTTYAALIIDRQMLTSKIYNGIVTLLSTGGAAFSLMQKYLIPAICSAIVAAMSIINQIHPIFFLKPEDIKKLCELQSSYIVYFHRVSDIFCLVRHNRISEEEGQQRFTKLVEEYSMKQSDISRILGKPNKRINKKAISKSNKYLNSIYYEQPEEPKTATATI